MCVYMYVGLCMYVCMYTCIYVYKRDITETWPLVSTHSLPFYPSKGHY